MTTTAANFTSTALAATVPLFTGPERGAHEHVFCAAQNTRMNACSAQRTAVGH